VRIAAVALLVAVTAPVAGQVPDVQARDAAALAPPGYEDEPVWETAIAAGGDTVVVLFNVDLRNGPTRIGYAVADYDGEGGWDWTAEGIVPMCPDEPNLPCFDRGIDPSIAFNPQTGTFVAAGLLRRPGLLPTWHIGVAFYDPSQGWTPWQSVREGGADKPWLVGGEFTQQIQEFYIVHTGADGYWYLRTRNAGGDWFSGRMMVASRQVSGSVEQLPAVYDDGPLYFAYKTGVSQKRIRFVKGEDIDDPNDPNDGGVEFDWLPRAVIPGGGLGPGSTKALEFSLRRASVNELVPGHERWYVQGLKTFPMLAADPTDPNRLFVVYHDTHTGDPNDTDVNIYVRRLRKIATGWLADAPIKVNDDQTQYESDQFFPAATVDENGYIHVIFYDDRRYNVTSDQGDDELDPQFDVWYAWSDVDLLDFEDQNKLLYEIDPNDPNEPAALDFTLDVSPGDFELGEYIGITWYQNDDAQRDEVWTTFTGTSPTEAEDEESLIWSSRIDWSWP